MTESYGVISSCLTNYRYKSALILLAWPGGLNTFCNTFAAKVLHRANTIALAKQIASNLLPFGYGGIAQNGSGRCCTTQSSFHNV